MWRDLRLAVGILALQFQPAGAQKWARARLRSDTDLPT